MFCLAYSTNGLQNVTLHQAIETIARYGFSGLEILLDTPHWEREQEKQLIKDIRQLTNQKLLTLTNLNANDCHLIGNKNTPNPRLLSHDESERKHVLKWHSHTLRIAQELNTPPISFAVGPLPEGMSEQQAIDHIKRHFDKLLNQAITLDTPISIEFEPEHFLSHWQQTKPIIKEFSHPLFGVNFDIGHSACGGEDIIELLDEILDVCHNIHFEDIKNKVHEHLIPGDGELPLHAFLDKLIDQNYSKGLTVELYNHSHNAHKALRQSALFFTNFQANLIRTL